MKLPPARPQDHNLNFIQNFHLSDNKCAEDRQKSTKVTGNFIVEVFHYIFIMYKRHFIVTTKLCSKTALNFCIALSWIHEWHFSISCKQKMNSKAVMLCGNVVPVYDSAWQEDFVNFTHQNKGLIWNTIFSLERSMDYHSHNTSFECLVLL
jgi:hypothetical protein